MANPLLQLKPAKIQWLRFGETYVDYRVHNATFKVSFPSHEALELAVEEWLKQAREQGEFFRLDVVKNLLGRNIKRRRRKDLGTDKEWGTRILKKALRSPPK